MSLNSVNLTPALLTSLYEKVLVETAASSMPAKNGLRFMGNNQKNILIVTSSGTDEFLSKEETLFLASVLAACKLSFDDVAIVNWENVQTDGKEIALELQSTFVILFDVSPDVFGLPINFPQFQIQQFSGRTYLHLPFLKGFEQDIGLKKQLWTSLKQLFQL